MESIMEWRVIEDDGRGLIITSDEGDICNLFYTRRIPEGMRTKRFENDIVNAELIAKAPEQEALIEELKEALFTAMLGHQEGRNLDKEQYHECYEVLKKVGK